MKLLPCMEVLAVCSPDVWEAHTTADGFLGGAVAGCLPSEVLQFGAVPSFCVV